VVTVVIVKALMLKAVQQILVVVAEEAPNEHQVQVVQA
jgi:hypothetical protein